MILENPPISQDSPSPSNILPFPLKPISDYAPSIHEKLQSLGISNPIIIGLDSNNTVTVISPPTMLNERALFLLETAKRIILNE